MCDWLYTFTGLCMFGCTLLQGYVCLAVHCYRVMYAWLYTVTELYMLRSLTVFILIKGSPVCKTASLHNLQISGGYLYRQVFTLVCYKVTFLPHKNFSVYNLGGK